MRPEVISAGYRCRVKFFKNLFLGVLFICLFYIVPRYDPGRAQTNNREFTFLHISDTHICNLAGYDPVFINARRKLLNNAKNLKNFFTVELNNFDIDAVFLTGDYLDFYEAKAQNGNNISTQIEQFCCLYKLCPVPFYMTLGNHDISSYRVAVDSSIQHHQFHSNRAKADWIRNYDCFRCGTYYSKTVQAGSRKIRFIFLDNGYDLFDEENGNLLDKPQLDWLEHQAAGAENELILLFMHQYFPVGDTNGDGIAFSKKMEKWPNPDICNKGFLKLINDSKSIVAAFVGDGHKNIVEEIDFPGGGKFYQIETAGFSENPNNWRIIKISDEILVSRPGSRETELRIVLPE